MAAEYCMLIFYQANCRGIPRGDCKVLEREATGSTSLRQPDVRAMRRAREFKKRAEGEGGLQQKGKAGREGRQGKEGQGRGKQRRKGEQHDLAKN
jgi:hypothetical protein